MNNVSLLLYCVFLFLFFFFYLFYTVISWLTVNHTIYDTQEHEESLKRKSKMPTKFSAIKVHISVVLQVNVVTVGPLTSLHSFNLTGTFWPAAKSQTQQVIFLMLDIPALHSSDMRPHRSGRPPCDSHTLYQMGYGTKGTTVIWDPVSHQSSPAWICCFSWSSSSTMTHKRFLIRCWNCQNNTVIAFKMTN